MDAINGGTPVPDQESKAEGRATCWKWAMIALILFNAYCVSFFFLFEPVFIHSRLIVPGEPPAKGTGAVGTTLVLPFVRRGRLAKSIFACYSPIHSVLKWKEWIWPMEDDKFIYEEQHETEK